MNCLQCLLQNYCKLDIASVNRENSVVDVVFFEGNGKWCKITS